MAIPYEPKPLPAVSTFPFEITNWRGVNKIKGGQAEGEMVNCKNMCSDNFPYASPRKPRKKLIDEQGIKRIYKVDGNRVYYIDADDYLCYAEDGVKKYLKDSDDNIIQMSDCKCTNTYDEFSVFYPYMNHFGSDMEIKRISTPLFFGVLNDYVRVTSNNKFADEYSSLPQKTTYGECRFDIGNLSATDMNFKMVLPEHCWIVEASGKGKYTYPEGAHHPPVLRFRFYDRYDKLKPYIDEKGAECLYIDVSAEITDGKNEYKISVPKDITFEKGDYCILRLGYFGNSAGENLEEEWRKNTNYALSAQWTLEATENNSVITGPMLDYGVVYNNRIVGVSDNDIRASALGDFTNFWEYADEAGNPSATGAYATDVGSAGDFTGICAYNNVLLLFKKNIVYEMHGSMPYTITELCKTGCIDNDSIASIDGVLYWASPKGIVRYSGGVPNVISTQIDIKTDGIAKAGTDGRKYYVFDGFKTYVFDTYYQMWHIEDDENVKMRFNHINDLYSVYDDGIYKLNSGNEAVEWEFETRDFTFQSAERKNLSKLWIRADMPKQSRLEVYAKQNGGQWQRVAVKTAEKDEMFDFKLRIKKCDSFSLKFKGKGDVRILDIHGKVTVGTSKHRSGASLNVYRK